MILKLKDLREHVILKEYTTMSVGGPADFFVSCDTEDKVRQACEWAASAQLGVFVLGEGSNIVVSDDGLHRLVLKMEIMGVEKVAETKDSITLRIGAGEHWDGVVERTVKLGLTGIEAMSAIPGTAGAAPVQNAGAYGQEISDTLIELSAYDRADRHFVTLSNADCDFGYRNSSFKTDAAGRYVITSITLRLSKRGPKRPTYESLKKYLDEHEIASPTVAQIRDGVIAVRARILPDPSVVPSCGSFFKSPIVSPERLREIEAEFKKVPSYRYGENYKIAAGWIVEQCGFKGSEHFGLRVWPNHALVITNPDHAGFSDLMKLVDLITTRVHDRFGITLEPEPQFVR